jgi:hypothetical protein
MSLLLKKLQFELQIEKEAQKMPVPYPQGDFRDFDILKLSL